MRIGTALDIGLIIRERRRLLGWEQRTLATRVGVSRQWIVEVEKGKPRAEVGLLLRTLRVLGLDLHADPAAGDPTAGDKAGAAPSGLVDVDAIVERARKRDDDR